MSNFTCRLLKEGYISKEELDRVFEENPEAGAEMDCSFLGFEDTYFDVRDHTDPSVTILDLGCSYASQCHLFGDYDRYIGVDICLPKAPFNNQKNCTFYKMDITDFIKNQLPALNLDLDNTVAVLNAVPVRKEVTELVSETFPLHYIGYPGRDPHDITIPTYWDMIQVMGAMAECVKETAKDKVKYFMCVPGSVTVYLENKDSHKEASFRIQFHSNEDIEIIKEDDIPITEEEELFSNLRKTFETLKETQDLEASDELER